MRLRSVLIAALLATACHSSPAKKKPDPELTRLEQHIGDFDQRLVAIRRAVPAAAQVDDQACPDAAIAKRLDGATGSVLLAEYEYLARYSGHASDRGRWKFLTTPALRGVPTLAEVHNKKQATDALWNIQKLRKAHPYLAVLRSLHRDLPRMDGQRFHPGVLQGGLFVFDLSNGKLLCRASVDAHSSDQVAGVKGQDRSQALWNDFTLQLRQQLDRALGRVSHQLELDFD